MRRLLRTILEKQGFAVEEVTTGAEAVSHLVAGASYTAILLDLMMPHEGGLTVLTHLRQTAPELLPRVIVITGVSKTMTEKLHGEVRAVVQKPFDITQLAGLFAEIVAEFRVPHKS